MEVLALLGTLVAWFAFSLLLYISVLAGYRITLHPLSKYPGPVIARLTDGYNLYHTGRRRLHIATLQNHSAYGSVVRVGPNKLVFSSVRALRDIYGNERVGKSRSYLVAMQSPSVHNIFDVIDKQLHREKRKLIGQVLTPQSMKKFEPIIQDQVDVFLGVLRKSEGEVVDMSPMAMHLGLDIVCMLAFGFPLHTQTSEDYRFLSNGMLAASFYQHLRMQWPLIVKLRLGEAMGAVTGLSKRRQRFRKLLEHMIQYRSSKTKDATHDFYSIVAESLGTVEPGALKESGMWSEAVLFLQAGGNTTGTAIAAIYFYLSRYPQVYKTLGQEIRTTFEAASEIVNGPKLASCRYLRACIDEAIRMSPPISSPLWREQFTTDTGTEPLIVDGHAIPRGTQLAVSAYALHHNPKYFADSFVYKPERWLSEGQDANAIRDAFNPFSMGARGCAGKAMAYMETSLLIAKTLFCFDFKVAPGIDGQAGAGVEGSSDGRNRSSEFQIYDIFAAVHEGPNLVFKARAGVA